MSFSTRAIDAARKAVNTPIAKTTVATWAVCASNGAIRTIR